MKKPLLLLFLMVIVLAACRKDPPIPPNPGGSGGMGFVRLKFVPEWEGQPFQPFTVLHNVSNYPVQVEKVQFYLSDLGVEYGTRTAQAAEILFMDLIDGPMDTLLRVPAGIWAAARFGLGVKEELDQTSPTLYPNDHPLSGSNGMHWPMSGGFGYIFTKFEGRHDTIPGGTGPTLNSFTIHTGSDTCYMQVGPLPLNDLKIVNGDTAEIVIKVAIDRFFYSATADTIDLTTEYMSHGSNIPLSMKLARNAANSFSIQ